MKKIIKLAFLSMLFIGCSSDDSSDNSNTLEPYISVQQKLNEGVTPQSLFNSGIILDSLYGKNYKGGLIYHLNTTDGSGLVAHTQDNSININWGAFGNVVDANNSSIGSGNINSIAIMNFYFETNTAADFCENLVLNNYSDWFLPSKEEMNKMMNILKNRPDVYFGAVTGYWTSTNVDFNNVWMIKSNNDGIITLKNSNEPYDIRIRATRKFNQ